MRRLLAIEDDEELLGLWSTVLPPRGWGVVGVGRLRDGIALLAGGARFDAVIVDLTLLDSDASRTLQALPALAWLARPARIVVTTGLRPPPNCPDVDEVLDKGSEGIIERLVAAISSHGHARPHPIPAAPGA